MPYLSRSIGNINVRRVKSCLVRSRLGRRTHSTDTDTNLRLDPAGYCKDLVRKVDYESYLISKFYPPELQNGYFAIKAFSVELATIQDHISDTSIGKMRMQFWRDAVKGISDGRPPRHPIAMALHEASNTANLPAYHLKRIVDARDAELSTPMHLTTDSLTSHAEATSSTVFYLLLSLLSLPSTTLSHAASHLGAAQTFSNLLRGLPFHVKNGRMVIPAEITARNAVNQENVFRNGPNAQGLQDSVFDFATIANDHLITCRDTFRDESGMGGRAPLLAMPIFLSGVPVANFLRRLEKYNFNAFEPKLQLRDWKLPWQIWTSYRKGQF